jgi:putative colanic acid biosynthesis acetyltransferase WcaF
MQTKQNESLHHGQVNPEDTPAAPTPRRTAEYHASLHLPASSIPDLYLRPAFSRGNRLRRLLWNFTWRLLYRPSPRPFHTWRAQLLRLHGARLGPHCHFYPKSKIWAPWNLICGDQVTAADEVEIYNPAPITLGSHAILSQNAFLCGATHDYDDPAFPLLAFRMSIGDYAWVCARASVTPGVNLGDGAVLGLGSVATRDLEPWTVYAGIPATKIKPRARPA